jgi:hypothetical protein
MRLPEEMEESFWAEMHQYEEGKKMEYITSVERIGIKNQKRNGAGNAAGNVAGCTGYAY